MKKRFRVVALCFMACLLVGADDCGPPQTAVVDENQAVEKTADGSDKIYLFNPKVGVTVGNHSYIYINKDGKPGEKAEMILLLLDSFEKAHPELEVTGWKIDKQPQAYGTPSFIFGMWIDHRPRQMEQ
jgi:hypothetical protein